MQYRKSNLKGRKKGRRGLRRHPRLLTISKGRLDMLYTGLELMLGRKKGAVKGYLKSTINQGIYQIL
jgi:hypothetical protein